MTTKKEEQYIVEQVAQLKIRAVDLERVLKEKEALEHEMGKERDRNEQLHREREHLREVARESSLAQTGLSARACAGRLMSDQSNLRHSSLGADADIGAPPAPFSVLGERLFTLFFLSFSLDCASSAAFCFSNLRISNLFTSRSARACAAASRASRFWSIQSSTAPRCGCIGWS